jgi:hypothetical protein
MRLNVKLVFLVALIMTASLPVWADSIPYANIHTPITTNLTATATVTGEIVGYFAGSDAGDEDTVQVCDITHPACSGYVFDNKSALVSVGTSANLLSVTAGDFLEFYIDNISTGQVFTSYATSVGAPVGAVVSPDGVDHAYPATYTDLGVPNLCAANSFNNRPFGGVCLTTGIPAGQYIGMEDLDAGHSSDWDYNNVQYVFTNVGASVPDGGTTASLLGFALAALGLLSRRMK